MEKRQLTNGKPLRAMLYFSIPLVLGNLLQQLYNVADTMLVGRFLGAGPLAAVGSAYTLMVFITSVVIGLCMGSGVVFSQLYGAGDIQALRSGITNAFYCVGAAAFIVNLLACILLEPLLRLLNIDPSIWQDTKGYLQIILAGFILVFLLNYFAALLRSVGDSLTPLIVLGASALLNIGLDLLFIVPFGWGVRGAALATVIAQGLSAVALALCFWFRAPALRPTRRDWRVKQKLLKRILSCSLLVSLQQSVMNFGILLVQGLVNSFGVAVTAAFAAGVKIDSFAYMPVQDFGNAYATFVAQNKGANRTGRIRDGARGAALTAAGFSLFVSAFVAGFAPALIGLFTKDTQVIAIGAQYLRAEGLFYPLIAMLFLLYGHFRGIGRPGVSLLLTFISLGARVLLAYSLAPSIGLSAIWCSIPAGWLLADITGLIALRKTAL